jgi:hypothetical protein
MRSSKLAFSFVVGNGWNRYVLAVGLTVLLAAAASADVFTFSTGNPDGLMAMASRGPDSQIEAADDFITTAPTTTLTSATFTGLLTGRVTLSNITEVNVDLYHVFPADSANPPSGHVTTRVNSPADTEFDGRNSTAGTLTFTPGIISASFTANNSVLNGINPLPGSTTGGEAAVTGQEVLFSVVFTTPISLPADHYFFVPTVAVTGGEFYWLSAPKPIVAPGTPFLPDLQAWARNAALDPDWLRVGTDIVGGNPAATFNAAFSLAGTAVAEPTGFLVGCMALLALRVVRRWG